MANETSRHNLWLRMIAKYAPEGGRSEMSETKRWTKGPWEYHDDGVGGCRNINAPDSSEVCYTVGMSDDDEDLANARLIAAAPELYEVLKALVDKNSGHNLVAAVAALAKAEGRGGEGDGE